MRRSFTHLLALPLLAVTEVAVTELAVTGLAMAPLAMAPLAAALSLGCADDGDDVALPGPIARTAAPLWVWIPLPKFQLVYDLVGHGLNGQGLNGQALSGQPLDGRVVVSVSLDRVAFPKGAPRDARLVATGFNGTGLGAGQKDLVGTRFSAMLDDGGTTELRIDRVVGPTVAPSFPFSRYAVTYATAAGPQPLCGVDAAGAPVLAIPLNGRWDFRSGADGGGDFIADEHAFTFACEGFVLAKCVEMGYPPWGAGKLCDPAAKGHGQCVKSTLQPWHQACTRMLRADYCGDGTSFTHDGVLVNVYDGIGVRADTEAWLFEAEWDERGARCTLRDRLPEQPPIVCQDPLALPACGLASHFQGGTRLMSEVEQ